MSELARQNGWHGFDNIGDRVPGGVEYRCDGMPSPFGCPGTLTITRRLARVGEKKSGWLVMYGEGGDGADDLDVVLTFCPSCAAVVRAQMSAADAEVGGHDCPCATGYGLACAGCDVAADVENRSHDANA